MQTRFTDSVWGIPHPPVLLFPNLSYMEEAVLKQENALQEEQRVLHVAAMALRAQPSTCQALPTVWEHPSLGSVLLVPLLLLFDPTPSPECHNPLWSGSHLPSAHVAARGKSCSTAWSCGGWSWRDALLKSLLPSMQPQQHQLPWSDSLMSLSRKHR